ncbi:hypothetical protein [Streptomyces sp. NPDC096013]|uniref:hypothetical protein n=1 Tax=Streptomyces sp. NPDC096013 TaxID=3366069 RepID=UPI0037F78CA4
MGERDCIQLIDGVQQLVKAPVLVWDRLDTHVSRALRKMIDDRGWLTAFLLLVYSPQLDSVEGLRAHLKRSLANLVSVALDRLGPHQPIPYTLINVYILGVWMRQFRWCRPAETSASSSTASGTVTRPS